MKRRLLPILMTLVLVCALPIWAAFVTSGDVTNPLLTTADATEPLKLEEVSTAGTGSFAIADLTAVHSECTRSGMYPNAATPNSGAVGDLGRTGHGKAPLKYKHTAAPAVVGRTAGDGAAGHHKVSF